MGECNQQGVMQQKGCLSAISDNKQCGPRRHTLLALMLCLPFWVELEHCSSPEVWLQRNHAGVLTGHVCE